MTRWGLAGLALSKGMTLADVARQSGAARESVIAWSQGKRTVTLASARRLAGALGCSVDRVSDALMESRLDWLMREDPHVSAEAVAGELGCTEQKARRLMSDRARIADAEADPALETELGKISNIKPQSNNKLGVRGVHWAKSNGKYMAQIAFKGRSYYLGLYSELEDAIEARRIAEEVLFGPTRRGVEDYRTRSDMKAQLDEALAELRRRK